MTVRHATLDDLPVLIELGRTMHAEAVALNHAPFDEDKVAKIIAAAISNGLVLVHENDGKIDGGFLGMFVEHWFSTALMFTDLALFVEPTRRGGLAAYRLIDAALEWCQARQIDPRNVVLASATGVNPELTGRLYERFGFRRVGGAYQLGSY